MRNLLLILIFLLNRNIVYSQVQLFSEIKAKASNDDSSIFYSKYGFRQLKDKSIVMNNDTVFKPSQNANYVYEIFRSKFILITEVKLLNEDSSLGYNYYGRWNTIIIPINLESKKYYADLEGNFIRNLKSISIKNKTIKVIDPKSKECKIIVIKG